MNKLICWQFCIVSQLHHSSHVNNNTEADSGKKKTEQLFRLKDKLIDQLNRHTEQTLIRRQLKHETSYETNPAWHETNARNNELWLYIFIYIYFFYQQMAQTKTFKLLYVLLFHNNTWSDEGTCKWHGGTSVNQTLAINFLFKRVFFHQKRTKTLTSHEDHE